MKERKDCDYKVIQENKEEYFHVQFSTIQNQQGFQVGFIVTFSNITERVVLQKKLQHLASIDGLTGVLNRTFFMEKAQAQFLKFQQHGGRACIIMFDVDRFKSVNDTFGHEAGDAVLTCISKIAKDALINRGFIGRYGGEEFIIYIPDVSFVEAYEWGDQVRQKIERKTVIVQGTKINVTSSFGVSCFDDTYHFSYSTLKDMIREADEALFVAKRNGRNRVHLATHSSSYRKLT
jgi:diguanylate cyclase (GGDEF)-like protein